MAGEYDKAKGHIKTKIGEMTDNPRLKEEGMIDKASGAVKSGVEKVHKAVTDVNKKTW